MKNYTVRNGVFGSFLGFLIVAVLSGWSATKDIARNEKTVQYEPVFAPDVPPPTGRTQPARVIVELEAVELRGEIADSVFYELWTYNGHVPGPFIRVRKGDTIEIHLKNHEHNGLTHTVDFHYVTGQGGGAEALMTNPGDESVAQFKALNEGLYIYHCAAPPIPSHIANGLYRLVLVEPEEGMSPADREYYIMQSEFYTYGEIGEPGFQAFSSTKGMAEMPEYVVFNGHAQSLLGEGALTANTGELVRLYVGNIGPNLISSFHVIGEIFDTVYREGSVSNGEHDIQTTLIPAGSASIVEFKVEVPANYILVDHSIFRIDRGALGILSVRGQERQDIIRKIQ